MESRLASIKWFLVITLVCLGGVEVFYQGFEYFILKSPKISPKVQQTAKLTETRQPVTQTETGEIEKPDYKIILNRNLFASYKEETTPEPEEAPKEEATEIASELNLVLMGTISGTENSRRAIILNKQTREQEIYSSGEVIAGALIEDIKRGEIILSIEGKTKRLDMSEAADMRPAYKPPPATTTEANQAGSGTEVNTRTRRVGSNVSGTSPRTTRRRVVRRPPRQQNNPE